MSARDLITADDPNAYGCTVGLVDHDYRPYTAPPEYPGAKPRTYLRCVWCHVVSCGDAGENDPCIEPYHHEPKPHRTRLGVTWPIGGDRPCINAPLCGLQANHRGQCRRQP